MGLFARKTIDAILSDAEAPERSLRRTLGPVQITMLGIGAIIGAGIFATIGTAAAGDLYRPGAGPALMLSFVLTAVACAFTALCYAEFAAMVPISGSAYTYAYASLGEVVAWIIGWDLIIEYAVGNVAVAISWANYFKTLVKPVWVIPDWLSTDIVTAQKIPGLIESAPHLFGVPLVFNAVAFAIVALITMVLVIGIRESSWFNVGLVIFKLCVLGFFVFVGWRFMSTDNWTPFMPNGWAGVGAGAAVIFFAYIGFDAVSTVAEETRRPSRDLPIGIIASLAVCTVIYIAVAAVFTGIIPYPELTKTLSTEQAEPLTLAFRYAHIGNHQGLFVFIIALGSVIAHTAVLLVFQLGQPRIFFSMARDGLLPSWFSKVHPRFRTPHVTTIATGLAVGAAAMVSSLDEMVDLTNIGTLFAFILVCIGIIVLRVKDPARTRPFRAPGGLVLPVLGALCCLGLIYYLPPTSWLRFAAWLNIGLVVYVCYGADHSRLTGLQRAGNRAAHSVRVGHAGAWLAVGGTVALFATRLADSLRQQADLAQWFLGNSWWMTVPLLLNAFVLCPSIVMRLRDLSRDDLSEAEVRRAQAARLVVIVLASVTAAYLLLVASV
jgi:APA family basic amino acid/polyamine antiporter